MRIIKYPHPTLRHKSRPLRLIDAELRKIVEQMLDAMYEFDGIGLAANQVDLPYRVFVMNTAGDVAAKDCEHVLINPVIVTRHGNAEAEEGCLSFPEIFAPVRRSEKIAVTAYNLAGEEATYQLSGLPARVAQHEYDHLDGVVFIDRLAPAARLSVREALADLEQEFQSDRAHGLIPGDVQIAARLAELEGVRT